MTATPADTHSRLAPSGASCWTVCTAQPSYCRANTDKIKDTDTDYSKEGVIAHDWNAKVLNGLADLSEVPDAFRPHVADYVAFAERLKEPGDVVFVESKVPLYYLPQDKGTVDYALVSEKRIYVLDYKHGAGVVVEARNNKQLAIYARSLIEELQSSGLYEFTPELLVTITIFQPRTHTGDKVKVWAVSLCDLVKFTDEIGRIAKLILDNETEANPWPVEFKPGDDTCQFCDAKKFCEARARWRAEPIPFDVLGTFTKEDIEDNALACLEPEQIARLVLNRKGIIKWLEEIAEGAQQRMETGEEIPGLKLVQGKEGNRAWVDEAAADTLVSKFLPAKERYTEPKLKSVAQMEKLLAPHEAEFSTRFKNRFAELVTRPAGGLTLVAADDPRPSAAVKATEVFTVVSGTAHTEVATPAGPSASGGVDESDPLA